MRKHFKTSLVCSTSDVELTIRIHQELYMDKYEKQQLEISKCTIYTLFFGKEEIIKGKKAFNKAKRNGLKIHLR